MVFRVDKNNNYTTMSNYHLREKNMSLKAKGLLSWMLSNTDDWDYSIAGIVANCKENETAIKSTLQELQEFGYLEIKKCMPNKDISVIHYEYIVHEQAIGNLVLDNLPLENLEVENHGQINTKERNTNIINTNKENISEKPGSFLGSANSIKKNTNIENVDKFLELYNIHCPSLPKVRGITEDRKKKILALFKNYEIKDIIAVFDNVEESDFLKGNNDRNWKANIDFIIRPDKFVSILEGKYGGKVEPKKRFNNEGKSVPITKEKLAEEEKWREEMEKRGRKTVF